MPQIHSEVDNQMAFLTQTFPSESGNRQYQYLFFAIDENI